MAEDESTEGCCTLPVGGDPCCRVIAIVSVDARGQMVLPKELRDAAGIAPGDKLAISTWEKDGKVVALSLTKANELAESVKALLGPLMKS